MKNAASATTDNGVNLNKKAANFPGDNSPKQRCNAMAEVAAPEHIRAVNMLAYALSLETSDGWAGASAVWASRLSESERVSLAFSALNSLNDDTAYMTASAALFGTLHGEALT